jgi:predicted MFS family arabinose efflux permease
MPVRPASPLWRDTRLLLESPPSSAGFLIMGGKFAALTYVTPLLRPTTRTPCSWNEGSGGPA